MVQSLPLFERNTNEIQKRETTEKIGELLRRSKPKKMEEKFRLFTGMSLNVMKYLQI